jgi:hypothetical protein
MPTILELKPLPKNLKYTYLDENQEYPIIIGVELTKEEENKLIKVVKDNKEALGWKFLI